MFAFVKRIFFFAMMNLAVILVLTAVSFVLERMFGIRVSASAG